MNFLGRHTKATVNPEEPRTALKPEFDLATVQCPDSLLPTFPPEPLDSRFYTATGATPGASEPIYARTDELTAVSVFGGTMKPKKMYKIGELMKHTRLSRQVLHNYTVMGLIEASERSEGGHRLYSEDVFDRLAKIELLKRHRTLQEVREELVSEDTRKSETTEAVVAGKRQ